MAATPALLEAMRTPVLMQARASAEWRKASQGHPVHISHRSPLLRIVSIVKGAAKLEEAVALCLSFRRRGVASVIQSSRL